MTETRRLGRGLEALLGPISREQAEASGALRELPVTSVRPNPYQPRTRIDEGALAELVASIEASGLLQPVVVRPHSGGFELIAGERRWRASQAAGLHEIPAIVREVSEAQAFELALVENLQRADLNPMEEADGYRRLVEEFGLTQEQVSQRVGKERSTVANALRLLGLPDEVKTMVAEGSLSAGHARALLGLPRMPELVEVANQVAAKRLSVRDTEKLVQQAKATKAGKDSGKPQKQSPQVKALTEELQRLLGTKVRIVEKGSGKGTLEVDYFSYDDLDRILKVLRKE